MKNNPLHRMPRGGRILLKLAFSFVATVLGLEGALWLLHPLSIFPEQWRCSYTQNLPGLKQEVNYARNIYGFRSVSGDSVRSKEKKTGTVRVLCLGASTTDLPTQNAEDAWWGVLEKRLNQEFVPRGRRIEVWARGRGGETVADALRWARNEMLSFSPDVIILLHGVNDLCWHGGPNYRDSVGQPTAGLPQKEWYGYPRWKLLLRSVSQIYRHTSAMRQSLRARKTLREGAAVEWHSEALPQLRQLYRQRPLMETLARDPDPIVEFKQQIEELMSWIRGHGIPCIVCAQPVLWSAENTQAQKDCLWMSVATAAGFARPGTAWLAEEMEKYNRIQESSAAVSGASFVDLAARLPRTTEAFFDDCHYTDPGNRLVADAIYPVLAAEIRKIAAAK